MRRLAEAHGADRLVVVFGVNQPTTLRIMARTFREGDPSWSGALAGVALGLDCYHILELRDSIPPEVWREQMAMEELQIDEEQAEAIRRTMREARGE